ncbi:cartilage intermediate layer protein 1-like isoform X1 [Oculina patagonica]
MALASEERNAKRFKGNKYVVNVTPSSGPNLRCLVFILAAVALVTLAGVLAILLPIYMKGNGVDKSNAATTSGRETISSTVKAVLSTMTTSQNFSKESSVDSFSSMSSTNFAISTASKAAPAMSSLISLVPNSEAKWTRWSTWSDCTKTCGTGARARTRICVATNQRAVFAPITCAGKPIQNKTCAEWDCPDCNRICAKGTLNDECNACTCDDHMLTGRILGETNVPLSEANISLAETPYRVLTQTNISGFFTAFNVCADAQQELFITKTGFVPTKKNATVLTPTTANVVAMLEIAVPPFVTVHPESKMRMPGQSVTFCCDGKGNPPPEIEWFKENNIIDKDLYNYNNTLEITAASGLNGTYRCRVVNDFGSEFSKTAVLKIVEEGIDSCSPTPNSKNLTLPDGCVTSATNSSIVDVGECQPVACLRNDSTFNSSCQDPTSCCGPRDFTNVLVDCGGIMSFNISTVTHCSCGECTEKGAVIQGIVVGGPEEEPMRYGDVIYGGEVVSFTDGKGTFSLTFPGKVTRAIVTFRDSFYEEFEERNKIFAIKEGSRDFYKIKLKRIPPPIVFNASEPLDIPLGSDPSMDSFADLELQEESFLTEDGSVFHGNAKATISVTDPRNLSDILTAPGDFTTTDEDGEAEILETYGMVNLKFEDDNRKQLALSKPMKVYLDPEKLNLTVQNTSDAPIKLYWLDKKTERWREVGDFQLGDGSKRRRKRSNRVFFVGTVTPAIALKRLNFDQPATQVAVRITTDPYPRTSGTAGVVVRVIRPEGTVYRGYFEETTTTGLVCIPIWRDKTCHIQAETNGKYMMPTKMGDLPVNIKAQIGEEGDGATGGASIQWIEFESILDENSAEASPVYHHSDYGVCQSSGTRSVGSQFTFQEPPNGPADFSILTVINRVFWVRLGCYLKIKVNDKNVIFAAESYKEDDFTETGKIGRHIRMSRTVTAGGSNIVCLQLSCPTNSAYTYVKIAPLTKKCTLKGVRGDLSRVQYPNRCPSEFTRPVCPAQPPAIQGQEKWLWIPKNRASQSTYGTFNGGSSGEARCLLGNQAYPGTTTNTVTGDGYALEYDCI